MFPLYTPNPVMFNGKQNEMVTYRLLWRSGRKSNLGHGQALEMSWVSEPLRNDIHRLGSDSVRQITCFTHARGRAGGQGCLASLADGQTQGQMLDD